MKQKKIFLLVLFILLSFLFANRQTIRNPVRETLAIQNNSYAEEKVYASGIPIGIYVKTEGLLVLGTEEVTSSSGRKIKPSEQKLKSGDYLLKMNETKLLSKRHLLSMLQKNREKTIFFTVLRNNEKIKVSIQPEYCPRTDQWKIGAWIRNDTQGIGTVTFVKQDGSFAALGHNISDIDIGVSLAINSGDIYETHISAIKKGTSGSPGELIGSIDYLPNHYLGTIIKNTKNGIFGSLLYRVEDFQCGKPIPIAQPQEIHTGKALLRTSICGNWKDYTIKIEKINLFQKDHSKAITIQITDPDLLKKTGGIVQGLSGSPIIQDGKLAGAVTHVLVKEPTKGYAIFADTMVKELKPEP